MARRGPVILALSVAVVALGAWTLGGTAGRARTETTLDEAAPPGTGASSDSLDLPTGRGRIRVCGLAGRGFKPYVGRLRTPAGVNVLADAPPDHAHHHGLMLAFGVNGVDFWSETPTCGRQKPLGPPETDGPPGTFGQTLHWTGPDGKGVYATERRLIRVHDVPGDRATLVTWRSDLAPTEGLGEIKLWGRHYFGLGMRLAASMAKVARFRTDTGARGEVVRGDERLRPGAWCACTGPVGGRAVTVALFDHPRNPRRALWFTMAKPFAYLSATLNLHRKPMTVTREQALSLAYGVAAWDGEPSHEAIGNLYARWVEAVAAGMD